MALTVEDVLRTKGISYTYSGKDFLIRCLNPEHPDKNPSLRIDKNFGIGQCFSCGFKLNIFHYFGEKSDTQSLKVLKIKEKIDRIYSELYGLSIPKGAIPFNKDYRNIKAKTYLEYDAFTHKDYEDRVVFPLKDSTDKIVAFIGRHFQSDAKPRYKIYPSNVELPIFPSKIKPIKGSIIIVEGIFDALNLIDKGLTNVIAALGVTTLGSEKKGLNFNKTNILKFSGVSKVFIMFDGDEAGIKAAELLKSLLEKDNFLVEIIELPEDTDPGDLTTTDIERLKKLI